MRNKITESAFAEEAGNCLAIKTKKKQIQKQKYEPKFNHAVPGLSMTILKSFSDGRRNFWNRRVGSGVKDLNLIETAIPKPAGLLRDEQSDHWEHSKLRHYRPYHTTSNNPERAVYSVPK